MRNQSFLNHLYRWHYLACISLVVALHLAALSATRVFAASLVEGKAVDILERGPAVVIITNMSARPGASPSLILALFALLSFLFGIAWLTRRSESIQVGNSAKK